MFANRCSRSRNPRRPFDQASEPILASFTAAEANLDDQRDSNQPPKKSKAR
jgi:hypothetical protein